MKMEGKVAIVTGGASGLGLATVEQLLEKGSKVAILDMDVEKVKQIQENYGSNQLLAIQTDVTDEGSVQQAINQTYDTFGAIHICVNCAGISVGQKTYSSKGPFDFGRFKKVIDVNLNGTFNVTRLVAEKMVLNNSTEEELDRGVIINTSSGAAFEGQMGQAAYSASKAGVAGMTLPIARDLSQYHIRINAIAPGLFMTPMASGLPESAIKKIESQIEYPKRLGNPPEFASLVLHIIENTYFNGEVVRLDGGTRLPAR
ncbi:SDR family NAD(P)-dependent oxidoreductase [Neobacillus niacini]|uniref:SDR family NAD(P)-dependent oxidoreductase n=1 Tax=Neobacillus niacini TaxID=86668 RepID=UPI0021CB3773|nr:SDR family NAD(P)-dependent oxidoreductase [Neobacillus niacini]MCM3766264.1 SDR family NAD(P)-dependent oxidoreductase [Neobacillus niacini]